MKTVYLVLLTAVGMGGVIAKEGEVVEVSEAEATSLLHRDKARLATPADTDMVQDEGPTVEEFVAAGYLAKNYPPDGYASRSTDEEILAAMTAQEAEDTAE